MPKRHPQESAGWNQQLPDSHFSSPGTRLPAPISGMNGHQSGGKLLHARGRGQLATGLSGSAPLPPHPHGMTCHRTDSCCHPVRSSPNRHSFGYGNQKHPGNWSTTDRPKDHIRPILPADTSPSGAHCLLFPPVSNKFLVLSLPNSKRAGEAGTGQLTCSGSPPSPAPPIAKGLTCSEFSGYSCRTARAPWTCKPQEHHSPTNIPGAPRPNTSLFLVH